MIRLFAVCCLAILFCGCPQINLPPTSEPTAAFLADSTSTGASRFTVQFTDMSLENGGAITSWSWSFGDGTTSTEQDPLHEFFGCNSYTVSLRVTNEFGSDIHVEEGLIRTCVGQS